MLEILDVGEYRSGRENLSVLSHTPCKAQQALNWCSALGDSLSSALREDNVEYKRLIIPFTPPVMHHLLSFPKKSLFVL